MSRIELFILFVGISTLIAFYNGKRVAKEGHSFTKTFIFTLIGLVGLFFLIAKLFTEQ